MLVVLAAGDDATAGATVPKPTDAMAAYGVRCTRVAVRCVSDIELSSNLFCCLLQIHHFVYI